MKIKVPIVLQMENVECGAACLAMVLAYYKKYVPLEKLRVDCGVSRDGSNLRLVCLAAGFYGLSPRPIKITADGIRESGNLPAVIHWNFNHFVVLTGFEKNKVLINDPAVGAIKVNFAEFERAFTGIALELTPSEEFERGGKPKNALKFIFVKLSECKALVGYIVLVGLLLTVFGITAPVFSRIFFDYILSEKSPQWQAPLLTAMTVTMLATFLLKFVRSYLLLKLEGRFSVTASSAFFWHLLRLPMDFFMSRFAGDIGEKQAGNDEIAKTLCTEIIPAVLSAAMIIIYLAVLFCFDVTLTVAGILIAAANIFAAMYNSKVNANAARAIVRDSGRFASVAIAGIEMIETIKASGAEQGHFERLLGYAAKRDNTQQEIDKTNARFDAFSSMLKELLNIFILILGVYKVLNGQFTIGILLAFQSFVFSFLDPVDHLAALSSIMQQTKSRIDHIDDAMNYPEETVPTDTDEEDVQKLSGDILIRNLCFSYNPLVTSLVEDFNLEIRRGEVVALVGGSGSGKSTIAKLIAGLLHPQSGEVLFDGKRKEEISVEIFSNSLATVDQQYTIFNDTVTNNITLWNDLISEQRVIGACRDAMLHRDIVERTGGYENVLAASGRSMSGGQCQRLDIARALVVDPTIIVLDEATSALDPITEKIVMDNIKQRSITTIIIAHRLSAIRDADRIIFLKNGKILQQGTHEELIQQNGAYARLIAVE